MTEPNEAMKAMARKTTYAADELIKQLRLAADVFHPAGQAADELTALRERVAAADKALYDGLVRASGARGMRISRLTDAIEAARAALSAAIGEDIGGGRG